MMNKTYENLELAHRITKSASKQTYYTIRFLADREHVADAYRAYAYFRWVDDVLDGEAGPGVERSEFIRRQEQLLESCYRSQSITAANPEERMLIDLTQHDSGHDCRLKTYLHNMMAVMAFDAERRGRLISQIELNAYTYLLASAVTEAMHYFIGHDSYSPHNEARYLAVSGAHIAHMLRDTFDDIQAGYFNIPREVLESNHLSPESVDRFAYRAWVRQQVQLARAYFKAGMGYLNQVQNLRCRMAGFMYTARFTWLLDTIEKEDYYVRPQYHERKSLGTGLRMLLETLSSVVGWRDVHISPRTVPVRKHY